VRDTYVGTQEFEDSVVSLPRVVQLHHRDLQSLLVHVAGLDARHAATDVEVMGDADCEPDQHTVDIDRSRSRDVREVAGGEPRVIGGQYVAVRDGVGRVFGEEVLHHDWHHPDEAGRCVGGVDQHVPRCVEDPDAIVVVVAQVD
jgi:hypothetical protein